MRRAARTAIVTVPLLVLSGACAIVLGIDEPNVVSGDGGTDGPGEAAHADAKPDSKPDSRPRDTGADVADASGCGPGATQCSGNAVETCGPDHKWGPGVACGPMQSCLNGACLLTVTTRGPSCKPGGAGMSNCGPASESCCASLAVPGGLFLRSYDAVTNTNTGFPATVSGFRLDKYEVTVGRFRQFVNAGSLPAAGSGKHAYLSAGGLSAGAEKGWDASWNTYLATTPSGWTTNLACSGGASQTWTASAGSNENLPINCIEWYEAYAFCIWDGGFLPTEAEWNYAAAGGSLQRVYPWSNPPTSSAIDCTHANSAGVDGGPEAGGSCASGPNPVGSESPTGDGFYGHADLSGNVWEWNLDYWAPYVDPWTNAADFMSTSSRAARGGSWFDLESKPYFSASYRGYFPPQARHQNVGARCARAP